jgi:hypothetical protein
MLISSLFYAIITLIADYYMRDFVISAGISRWNLQKIDEKEP